MPQSPIASSDRIRELWAINADVPALLTSASNAVNALTDRPITSSSSSFPSDTSPDRNKDPDTDKPMPDSGPADLAAHKQASTDSSKAYFTNLQSILARLRRSVYALEEAGIIEPDAPVVTNSRETAEKKGDEDKVTNGGLGNLDVGVLNSRVNAVGRDKEVELLEEARGMLANDMSGP